MSVASGKRSRTVAYCPGHSPRRPGCSMGEARSRSATVLRTTCCGCGVPRHRLGLGGCTHCRSEVVTAEERLGTERSECSDGQKPDGRGPQTRVQH